MKILHEHDDRKLLQIIIQMFIGLTLLLQFELQTYYNNKNKIKDYALFIVIGTHTLPHVPLSLDATCRA